MIAAVKMFPFFIKMHEHKNKNDFLRPTADNSPEFVVSMKFVSTDRDSISDRERRDPEPL